MIDVQCKRCGGPVPHMAHASAKYCSERCKKTRYPPKPGTVMWNSWQTRRKALHLPAGPKQAPSVADLIQRDGLDCHICGTPIDYTLNWSDPAALSVDHLIPVSDRRSFHGLGNLKLAHRRCNANRSNHIYNERITA